MAPVVGIDLGTSNSSVASFLGNQHQILSDEQGRHLTPSVVSFGKEKRILVGADAKAQLFANPKRTITSIKRLIGRKIFSPEVKKAQVLLPYKLVETDDQNVGVDIGDGVYTPQEISALILKHLKEVATKKLGAEVTQAVVTVPAHFNDNQRQATKDACKIAGLDTLRIINEPTAAALAYGFGKGLKETVAIYDLGGGTFDISILKLKDQVFEVLATAGDTFLGGDDFDDRIIDLCAESFLKKADVDLRKTPGALPLLRSNAESAKRKLSYAEKTDIYIPGVIQKDGQPIDLQFTLTREIFFKATNELIQKTFTVCDEALRSAGLRPSDLDAVILVGGPTKMSLIYEVVGSYFGKSPLRDLNPDEVVSIGASIQAQSLSSHSSSPASQKTNALLLDVTPLDLGIATVGGYIETVVEANSPIPIQASKLFTTTQNNQENVQVRIFQGKNRREEESNLLGTFELSGFKKGKAGDASIEVFFSINTDGIVEVSAKDKETGASQSVKVKLSAALDPTKLKESKDNFNEFKEVKLKNTWEDSQKVVFCTSSVGGPVYDEGYVSKLNPLDNKFDLVQDGVKVTHKEFLKEKICWLMTVEDFSNIPRYLQAFASKPSLNGKPSKPIYQFRLKDGTFIYGQTDTPNFRAQGFWIEPFSEVDRLSGKLFLYSAQIQESAPLAS
ncbi:MAG: Molecular chaperone DnaK [Bacteriovoracaceae bacterium]|nr:Molecular chaperone DnaK [Bacteriovoracaceae bacterium]